MTIAQIAYQEHSARYKLLSGWLIKVKSTKILRFLVFYKTADWNFTIQFLCKKSEKNLHDFVF